MCATCKHWERHRSFVEHDTRFAPCALRPDMTVPDRRTPSGREVQAYVMSETYECGKFAEK